MSDFFRIKWTNKESANFVDLLSTQLFHNEVSREILHRFITPRGPIVLAKCTLKMADNVAMLAYAEDEQDRWYPGTTKIVFSDNTRQSIKEVLWADEDTDLFENLSPIFERAVDQEARDEVERQLRLGKIASRPEQTAFSMELRELYEGRCAVTRCDTIEVLEAAHIQVKRGADNNDMKNGILLRADIHALFDAGLISLSEDGTRVQVRAAFHDDSSYQFLNNAFVHRPNHDAPSKENILHHRRRFNFA